VLQKVDRHPLIPLHVLADRNRGAAYLTLMLGQGGVFALFLFLTYYFQDVLHYSPIKTGRRVPCDDVDSCRGRHPDPKRLVRT